MKSFFSAAALLGCLLLSNASFAQQQMGMLTYSMPNKQILFSKGDGKQVTYPMDIKIGDMYRGAHEEEIMKVCNGLLKEGWKLHSSNLGINSQGQSYLLIFTKE